MNKLLIKTITFGVTAALLTGATAVYARFPSKNWESGLNYRKHPTETSMAVSETATADIAPVFIPIEQERRPYDANGRAFVFLGGEEAAVHDVYTGELNGEILNDAVYERNIRTEEMHNVGIKEVRTADVNRMAWMAVMAADDFYDAVVDSAAMNFQLATRGALYDLNKLDALDLSAAWWDSPINDDTAVLWRNYIAAGDLLVNDNNAAVMLAYNRAILEKFGIEDNFAHMVFDGSWTNEAFEKLMQDTTYDINGDAVLSYETGDIIGIASKIDYAKLLGTSNGVKSVTINKDSGLLKLWNVHNSENLTELLKHIEGWGYGWYGENADEVFTAGNSALYAVTAGELASLKKTADFEIGILPLPKSDSAQESCITYVNPNTALTIAVPVMERDLEFAGTVLETMAQYSYKLLTPAYYETLTRGDADSAMMLDVIFSGMTVQFDEVLGINVTADDAKSAAKAVEKINSALSAMPNS